MRVILPPGGILACAENEKEERKGWKGCHTLVYQPGTHCWCTDAHFAFLELTLMKANNI